MLVIRNLSKTFKDGKAILSSISIQIDQGDFIAIIGKSGSGKTTLLNCLTLKETWDQGQYIYNNVDLLKSNALVKWKIRKHWVYLSETPPVNESRTALQNVLTSYLLKTAPWKMLLGGRGSADDHMKAMDYLQKVGLLDKANVKVGKMSGGEKQRVGLAKLLVRDPKIIFADDPTLGLDPHSAERVLLDLQSISRQQRVTIICTINNVEWAQKYASRIWGLTDHKIKVDVSGRRLTTEERLQIL